LLLESGADVNAKSNSGSTPLHEACEDGHLELANMLVENGADIRAKKNDGSTPLHSACEDGHLEVAMWLVENGADVNTEGGCLGSTPLHKACDQGHLEVVKFLVENEADVHAKDDDILGWTPLQLACEKGHLEVVKWLVVQNGADMHAKRDWGSRLLHQACEDGHLEVVKWLVQNGAGMHAKRDSGSTLLHKACENGNLEVVKWLVQHGAAVNAKCSVLGSTPLHEACLWGHFEVVKLLVEKGANVYAKNIIGEVPVDLNLPGNEMWQQIHEFLSDEPLSNSFYDATFDAGSRQKEKHELDAEDLEVAFDAGSRQMKKKELVAQDLVAIFCAAVFVIAATVVGVLLLGSPAESSRDTIVKSILVEYAPFNEQALNWLIDTDTWEPDKGDPNRDYLWLERYVMAVFYFSINGPNWSGKDTWLSSQPVCNWEFSGVTNECPGPITSLRLPFNPGQLTGRIPSLIGNLSLLTQLDLGQQSLTGTIPSSIGNLGQLTSLSLGGNYLSGSIPPSIGSLDQLAWLELHDNNLSGSVPILPASSLDWCFLYGNCFPDVTNGEAAGCEIRPNCA